MTNTLRRPGCKIDPPSSPWTDGFKVKQVETLPSHETRIQRKTQLRHEIKAVVKDISRALDAGGAHPTEAVLAEVKRLREKQAAMEKYYDQI